MKTVIASSWAEENSTGAPLIVAGAMLLKLPQIIERRGCLTIGEWGQALHFPPRRFFVIYGVPNAEIRGEHAHRKLIQFLICLSGSVRVIVDDGQERMQVLLDSPRTGLHLPPMTWAEQFHYTADAVLLVLASAEYDSADYIRSYDEFLHLKSSQSGRGA